MHQWRKAKEQIEEMQRNEKETKSEEDKSLIIKKAVCLEGLSDWESLLQLDEELIKVDNEIDNKNNKVKNDEDSFTGKACRALHSLGCFFNGRCKVCKHYVEDHEVFQNSIWMCKECPEESNLCKSL